MGNYAYLKLNFILMQSLVEELLDSREEMLSLILLGSLGVFGVQGRASIAFEVLSRAYDNIALLTRIDALVQGRLAWTPPTTVGKTTTQPDPCKE